MVYFASLDIRALGMHLLRTMDGLMLTLTDREAEAVRKSIHQGSKAIEVQGNLIRTSQITGVYTESAAKQLIARDRGLIMHGDKFMTPREALALPIKLPERQEGDSSPPKRVESVTGLLGASGSAG